MSPIRTIMHRRRGAKRLPAAPLVVCALLFSHSAFAEVAVEQVLEGLHTPSGIAIAPGAVAERYEVFVAESGRGRIVMFPSDLPSPRSVVIEDFAAGKDLAIPAAQLPMTGPLALAFLDKHRLVVGLGGEGLAGVRLYELGARTLPLRANQPAQKIGIPQDGNHNSSLRDVRSIARTRANDHVADTLLVSCTRADEVRELWKIPVRAGTLGEASPFVASDDMSGRLLAAGIAVGPQGYVVVVERSEDEDKRSRLTFYDPVEGKAVLQLALDLPTVAGLAYSLRGNLYAIDFGSGDSHPGGVYRLDDAGQPGKPACEAVKIADAPQPTALAFGPDGALYVSSLGKFNSDHLDNGVLLKVTGEL